MPGSEDPRLPLAHGYRLRANKWGIHESVAAGCHRFVVRPIAVRRRTTPHMVSTIFERGIKPVVSKRLVFETALQ